MPHVDTNPVESVAAPCPGTVPPGDSAWRHRPPERSTLYRILQQHLATFLSVFALAKTMAPGRLLNRVSNL